MSKSTFTDIQRENPKKKKSILRKELYASEVRYRRLFESAKDGILILDAETGKIVDVNPFLMDLLGFTKQNFIEKSVWEIGAFQDIIENKEKFLELQQKKYVRYDDLPLQTSTGKKIHVEFVSNVYIEGRHEVIQCNIRDITERKRAEMELMEAKVKAEENDRLKSAFLANMSHEIRTPMNGILGFAELLRTEDLTGDKRQKFIGIVEKSGARLLNLINDIISISKIESNQIEITFSDVDINLQVEDIFNFFRLEAENKKLKLSFKNDLPANEAIIKTDSQKVYSALANLVKNAIKFTQTGSIELGYLKKDGFLEFYVKDSGTGVSSKQKKLIFERFRQGSEALTREYEGAGLGLSISKAYIEMLGGKIWVENNANKNGVDSGVTFFFTIPVSPLVEVNSFIKGNMKDKPSVNLFKLEKKKKVFYHE